MGRPGDFTSLVANLRLTGIEPYNDVVPVGWAYYRGSLVLLDRRGGGFRLRTLEKDFGCVQEERAR